MNKCMFITKTAAVVKLRDTKKNGTYSRYHLNKTEINFTKKLSDINNGLGKCFHMTQSYQKCVLVSS